MGNITEAGWNFDNTYTQLPEEFFARIAPTPVRAPKMAVFNQELAKSLGLGDLANDEGTKIFAGSEIPPGADPIAQAYAGHQFGHFTMLGDGRANLLGEHVTPKGLRFDVQLKGSGPSKFSRRGDGRAALGPMLREYVISEAMHALGIPTTRSLAVVTTGEPVFRETPLPGAVLTRIAQSHIRVGTFEYAAVLKDLEKLRALADYTIERHYSHLASEPEPYLALLKAVVERQASLVAKWMLVGFIHGVMNTDNMTLSGETIDYGPCAFMDRYSLSTVFSSIDHGGRYAYGNQPPIAQWNLTRLAEALLPLLAEKEEDAIAKAEEAIGSFVVGFERHWMNGMLAKLGLQSESPENTDLIVVLLRWMEKNTADYTNTFRALANGQLPSQDSEFSEWYRLWEAQKPSLELMLASNPAVIPRNHKVEEALAAAVEREDYSVMERLLTALKTPFTETAESAEYAVPSADDDSYQTFCGT